MKALSVRQPYAWAICHAGKRVENRAWLRSPGLLAQARALTGQRVALHASAGVGKRDDFDAAAEHVIARCRGLDVAALPPVFQRVGARWAIDAEAPRGAVVGTARLVEVVLTKPGGHRFDLAGVRCLACGLLPVSAEPPCPATDPWAIPGMVGLVLSDVVALPHPVPLAGRLGFFEVGAVPS